MRTTIIVARPQSEPATAGVWDNPAEARKVFKMLKVTNGTVELWDSARGRLKIKKADRRAAAEPEKTKTKKVK